MALFDQIFETKKDPASSSTKKSGGKALLRKKHGRDDNDNRSHEKRNHDDDAMERPKKKKKVRPPKKKKMQESSTRTNHNNSVRQPMVRSKGAPSGAALALSAELKALSLRKRLRESLDMYWNPSNDSIRDGHHASIVVDCCSRCGAVEEAEKIVNSMKDSGTHISVQANTALLKGYAHSGQIEKGDNLFKQMMKTRDTRDRPNIRTLNTLLRGCLWTAANVHEEDTASSKGCISGGVITSEEAWTGFQKQSPDKKQYSASSRGNLNDATEFDSSSYEYSVALLCQALNCDLAERRISEFKIAMNIKSSLKGNAESFVASDSSVLESLALSLLALARSYILLGRYDEAQQRARASLNAADDVIGNDNKKTSGSDHAVSFGGKRAWRDSANTSQGVDIESRRAASNTLFRSHRLSELKSEAQMVIDASTAQSNPGKETTVLAKFLVSRLLYFSGGGTTTLSSANDGSQKRPHVNNERAQLMNALWLSFGLAAAVGRDKIPTELRPHGKDKSVLAKKDESALHQAVGNRAGSILSDDGMIDFMQVFSSSTSSSSTGGNDRPLNIELGAGSGDWIVSQAQQNKLEDYVSVELRADRVAQTFAKCMLNMSTDKTIEPLENVCCVGAECGSFLRDRIIDGSVSSIYVNHPEPPTQTYGSDDKDLEVILESDGEPAHMLNSTTVLAAAKCLKQDGKGKLIIVTDNRWYATLICVTLQKAMNEHTNLLQQLPLERCNGMYQVQSFDTNNSGRLILYEGQPCSDIGHCVPTSLNDSGTSYFDRLWRTGAGRHAEMKKRFIIAVQTFDSSQPAKRDHIHFSKGEKQSYSISSAPSVQRESKASASTTQSNKKISAKQQRRNERRLLAKQLKSAKK